MSQPAVASLTLKSAATSGSRPMMTNSVSPIPNPPRASAIRPIGMEVLLQNCTERFVRRKLLVADALFIVAQAIIPRKQLNLWAARLPGCRAGQAELEGSN